jgi:hypothetical protein
MCVCVGCDNVVDTEAKHSFDVDGVAVAIAEQEDVVVALAEGDWQSACQVR